MRRLVRYQGRKDLSIADFLRHAMLVRALRSEKHFRKGAQGRYLIIVPDGHRAEDYDTAAAHFLAGHDRHSEFGMLLEAVDVLKRESGKGSRQRKHKQVALRDRLLLLADHVEAASPKVLLGLDRVIHLDPPTRHQWRGALWLYRRRTASNEELEELESLPLDLAELALRPGRSVAEAIRQVHKVLSDENGNGRRRDPRQMSIHDLPGYGPAADWARDLAIDLSDWQAGGLPWADVDKGVLLSGPPGTGKTTFAAALAHTCSAHLVAASVARWQAAGHLGDLLKAMRADFAEARDNAPSILFIDEFDSIGDRATFTGDSAHYCIEVVNGLLECIDGLDGREGIIVVGACNNPGRIDPALLRPGRLDRHIAIPLPDAEARAAILAIHAGNLLDETARAEIAELTDGFSGADLEALARRARRRARKERRDANLGDFHAELPQRRAQSEESRRIAAVHEAGHAVLAASFGHNRVLSITISPSLRRDIMIQRAGNTTMEPMTARRRTRSYYIDEITMLLGGIAAEALVEGTYDDGGGGARGSDLHLASDLATIVESSFGLGDSLVYHDAYTPDVLERLRRTSPAIRQKVHETLEECFERASALLADHRSVLDRITEQLLADGRMDGEKVHQIVEAAGNTGLRLSG